MRKLLFVLLFAASFVIAQSPIPFASLNNTIELSVRNSSALQLTNVKVAATGLPVGKREFHRRKMLLVR
jgi:hypothetical protein